MADEYIKVDDAINRAYELYEESDFIKAEELSAFVKSIPAADVRPLVRGRWIESYNKWTPTKKCSSCGSHFWQFAMKDVGVGDKVAPVLNFCPNCGADMREVDDAANHG